MHIKAIFAASVNGRITRGDDAKNADWTSAEDKKVYAEARAESRLIIMGKTTYEVYKSIQKLSPDCLRIVLTSNPEEYEDEKVPGQLEFLNGNPAEIVTKLEGRGYQEALLLGGAVVMRDFVAAGLLDELLLTVEPLIFGKGRPLVEAGEFNAQLRLLESRQLNDRGTLLLHYSVIKSI